jgi:hypothetical protein
VQVVASRRCMGQDSGSNLQADLLSADTTGLMLLDDAQKEVPVASLTAPVTVCLDMDASLYQQRALWWTQKASCSFYDSTKGKMSFDGCEPVKVVDVAGGGKQICCNCSHLRVRCRCFCCNCSHLMQLILLLAPVATASVATART